MNKAGETTGHEHLKVTIQAKNCDNNNESDLIVWHQQLKKFDIDKMLPLLRHIIRDFFLIDVVKDI